MRSEPPPRIPAISWFERAREDPSTHLSLALAGLAERTDPAIAGLLHGVAARSSLELQQLQQALTHAALATSSPAGLAEPLADEVLRANLVALHSLIHMRMGALAPAEEILDTAATLVSSTARGLLASQRSAVLYCRGALSKGMQAADEAVALLTDPGVDRARALNNRAVISLYLGGSQSGLADFEESERLLLQAGHPFLAADIAHNKGMMLARLGDLPRALDTFARAEHDLAALGAPIDVQLVSRCEVLAMAGLVEDVVDLLPDVIRRLTADGMSAHADEAHLTLAMAQTALELPDAPTTAAAASEAFRRSGRLGWAAIADDLAVQARQLVSGPDAVEPGAAGDVAERLESAGMTVFSAGAWMRASEAALAYGDINLGLAALDRVRSRHRGVIERLLAAEASARRSVIVGDEESARRTAERGLRLLERHRSLFAATELKVSASAWGEGLASVLVGLADRSGTVRDLLEAGERWRATALATLSTPSDPDPTLAALLADHRAAVAGLQVAVREELPTHESDANVRRTEAAVATELRRRSSSARTSPRSGRRSSAADLGLQGRVLVAFVVTGRDVSAVIAHDTSFTKVRIGPLVSLRRSAAAASAALRRLAAGLGGPADSMLRRGAEAQLDRLRADLVRPLLPLLPDRMGVVIVPIGPLHGVPWGHLFGREVSVVPSARWWADHEPARTATGNVALIAGPGLDGADLEVAALTALYPSAQVWRGDEATVELTSRAMADASLVHLACHGSFRTTSPLFSSLLLADGPMTGFDLERLPRAPDAVVLSACSVGSVSRRALSEPVGIATLLLSLGSSAVVASSLPLPDRAAVPRMIELHRRLATGSTIGGAVAAVAGPDSVATTEDLLVSCALTCFGRGDWTPTPPPDLRPRG